MLMHPPAPQADPDRYPQRLAAAVILQAIADLRQEVRPGKSPGSNPTRVARSRAWAFLTAERGPWAASRHDWCACLDLDPERLRAAVLRGDIEGMREGLEARP